MSLHDELEAIRSRFPAAPHRDVWAHVMRPAERGFLLMGLYARWDMSEISREMGVSRTIVKLWLRPARLEPEVKDALDLGERGGVSFRYVSRFYAPGRSARNPGAPRFAEPLPREEQLRLLAILRGVGRVKDPEKRVALLPGSAPK